MLYADTLNVTGFNVSRSYDDVPPKSTDTSLCMTRSSTKELITPFKNPERVFRSKRRLFETPSLVESNSPKFDLFSDIEEEETTKIMTETMEQYMSKTRGNYGGSEHEDANEHIEKFLEIVDLFHIPEVTQDQIMLRAFPMSLTRAASRWHRNKPSGSITNWETLKTKFLNKYCPPDHTAKKMEEINNFQHILDSKSAIPTKTVADVKVAIQEMAEYSQKWHNGTSSKARSTETSDRLVAMQAQLNNLGREIKKVNEKVYVAQVGCELCKGPHYTKDCSLKEEGKTPEDAYYTQFEAPYQPGGQYRATGPGFYQRNNENSSYPDQRQTLEESLTKFMADYKKSRSVDKDLGNLNWSNEQSLTRKRNRRIARLNRKDHVKSISTAKFVIRRIGSGPYAVLDAQYSSLSSEIVPFLNRLHGYCCDNWKEAREVKILEAYDHTLPQKEKDLESFTLPCFIYNVCFDKALVDLGASVSVMSYSTYSILGLGYLAHTRLTIELADRTIKHLRGIAENVLVKIGKFNFPIDFVILDIPEDKDVPLILERPFLSKLMPR
ncbi:hypothetical protein Tco_0368622 [Tanacetum coccineum]